jgi:hypothetical protein
MSGKDEKQQPPQQRPRSTLKFGQPVRPIEPSQAQSTPPSSEPPMQKPPSPKK